MRCINCVRSGNGETGLLPTDMSEDDQILDLASTVYKNMLPLSAPIWMALPNTYDGNIRGLFAGVHQWIKSSVKVRHDGGSSCELL